MKKKGRFVHLSLFFSFLFQWGSIVAFSSVMSTNVSFFFFGFFFEITFFWRHKYEWIHLRQCLKTAVYVLHFGMSESVVNWQGILKSRTFHFFQFLFTTGRHAYVIYIVLFEVCMEINMISFPVMMPGCCLCLVWLLARCVFLPTACRPWNRARLPKVWLSLIPLISFAQQFTINRCLECNKSVKQSNNL